MIEFTELLNFVECNLKNNIKENDYIILLRLIQKIYLMKKAKQDSDDEDEDYNDVYGSYWLSSCLL